MHKYLLATTASFCAVLSASAQSLIFQTDINSGDTPIAAGGAYTGAQFIEDTTFVSGFFSTVSQQLINLSGPFGTEMIIGGSSDNGLTTVAGDWENFGVGTANSGARHALRYDLGVGTSDFQLGDLVIEASGVTDDGIGATVAYNVGGTFFFESVSITADGTHTISLGDNNILFTNGTSGLNAFGTFNFRVFLHDPNATSPGTGNAVIESVSLFTAVPEPSAYALIAGLIGMSFVVARRRK